MVMGLWAEKETYFKYRRSEILPENAERAISDEQDISEFHNVLNAFFWMPIFYSSALPSTYPFPIVLLGVL